MGKYNHVLSPMLEIKANGVELHVDKMPHDIIDTDVETAVCALHVDSMSIIIDTVIDVESTLYYVEIHVVMSICRHVITLSTRFSTLQHSFSTGGLDSWLLIGSPCWTVNS